MESEEPFGGEMPNFDICGTVFKELFKDIDVLDIDAKPKLPPRAKTVGGKVLSNWQVTLSHFSRTSIYSVI